jgi:hypothetical protein
LMRDADRLSAHGAVLRTLIGRPARRLLNWAAAA